MGGGFDVQWDGMEVGQVMLELDSCLNLWKVK